MFLSHPELWARAPQYVSASAKLSEGVPGKHARGAVHDVWLQFLKRHCAARATRHLPSYGWFRLGVHVGVDTYAVHSLWYIHVVHGGEHSHDPSLRGVPWPLHGRNGSEAHSCTSPATSPFVHRTQKSSQMRGAVCTTEPSAFVVTV